MMLRHRAPEVVAGPDLPAGFAAPVDRVLLLDNLCCTAVAMSGGSVSAMVVATSKASALRRLSLWVEAAATPALQTS